MKSSGSGIVGNNNLMVLDCDTQKHALASRALLLFNLNMILANYQIITLKNGSYEELNPYLSPELNLRHPVAFVINHLDKEIQREMIGLIENFFSTANLSFILPYPIYIVTHFNQSLSKISLVAKVEHLPKFFHLKDGKLNNKEIALAEKSKMLQQELRNLDPETYAQTHQDFAATHRKIFYLSKEKKFYKDILGKIKKTP
jgi:hypothetical protein